MKFDHQQMMYGSVMAAAAIGSARDVSDDPTTLPGACEAFGATDTEAADPLAISARALVPTKVALDLDMRDKQQLLEAAARSLEQSHGLAAAPIFRALARREEVGSTALGQGIAIPHARIAGLDRPLTFLMRTASPIPFDAPDGKPVSTFMVIFVPESGETDEHLQLLALVAEMFTDMEFRARLADATEPSAIWYLFAHWIGRRFGGTDAASTTRGA